MFKTVHKLCALSLLVPHTAIYDALRRPVFHNPIHVGLCFCYFDSHESFHSFQCSCIFIQTKNNFFPILRDVCRLINTAILFQAISHLQMT